MELFARTALIVFAAGVAFSAAFFQGDERPDLPPMKALRGALLSNGALSVLALVWWPTPDLWSTVAKFAVVGLLGLDVARDVVALKWPRPPVFTAVNSWVTAIGALLALACTVFLWP
jgi:hypothetical protein